MAIRYQTIVHISDDLSTLKHIWWIINNNLTKLWFIILFQSYFPLQGGCSIGHPPETHIKLKSRDISSANNLLLSCRSILAFCTEHGSITTVLCAHVQTDLVTAIGVQDDRTFTRFEFKMCFWRIPILQQPTGSSASPGKIADADIEYFIKIQSLYLGYRYHIH